MGVDVDDQDKECKAWFIESTDVHTKASELSLAGLGAIKTVLLSEHQGCLLKYRFLGLISDLNQCLLERIRICLMKP